MEDFRNSHSIPPEDFGRVGLERPSRPQSASADTSTPLSQSQEAFPTRVVERSHGHESKPRLSKEQSHVLETAFQQCHKPSTNVKKSFSKKLNLPAQKVNVRIDKTRIL